MDALARAAEDFLYDFEPRADVPLAAAEALAEGMLSPALIDLACLRRDDRSEIHTLIPQLFNELGRPLPSRPAAAFARAQEAARETLDGARSYDEGLLRLIRFLMQEDSCGDSYCHGYGDILRFEETYHAQGSLLEGQPGEHAPDWFPDNDALEQFTEFLGWLVDSDHACAGPVATSP